MLSLSGRTTTPRGGPRGAVCRGIVFTRARVGESSAAAPSPPRCCPPSSPACPVPRRAGGPAHRRPRSRAAVPYAPLRGEAIAPGFGSAAARKQLHVGVRAPREPVPSRTGLGSVTGPPQRRMRSCAMIRTVPPCWESSAQAFGPVGWTDLRLRCVPVGQLCRLTPANPSRRSRVVL